MPPWVTKRALNASGPSQPEVKCVRYDAKVYRGRIVKVQKTLKKPKGARKLDSHQGESSTQPSTVTALDGALHDYQGDLALYDTEPIYRPTSMGATLEPDHIGNHLGSDIATNAGEPHGQQGGEPGSAFDRSEVVADESMPDLLTAEVEDGDNVEDEFIVTGDDTWDNIPLEEPASAPADSLQDFGPGRNRPATNTRQWQKRMQNGTTWSQLVSALQRAHMDAFILMPWSTFKKEKVNMDYTFVNAVNYYTEGTLSVLGIYDINCQYSVNFLKRVDQSPELSINEKILLWFAIGLFHVPVRQLGSFWNQCGPN
ncbi:hypothetical protein OF83DRAFT_1176558 [Amylostereum chailletii]|nr:hypothetical protein OF83DRAFT_1176558 [Amylostereum chailletii]